MIYLDTHAAIWIYCGMIEKFSQEALDTMNLEDLYLSPMVALEMEYLNEVKKISVQVDRVLVELESNFGAKQCDLPFAQVTLEARNNSWTRDPFDRIITAHASLTQSTLVTKDELIRQNYNNTIF